MLLTSIAAAFAVSFSVCLLFLGYWRRRIRRGLEAEMMLGRIRDEIDEMIIEINRTADRNVTLLENRITRLNSLIQRAEKLERVREREAEKDTGVERVYSELGRNRGLNITVEDNDGRPGLSSEPIPESIPEPESPGAGESGPESPPAGDTSIENGGAVPDGGAVLDGGVVSDGGVPPMRERVLTLHRRGESLQSIAESLNMNRGEVELIISLHGRKGSVDSNEA